jgi:rhomboid protease GluP
MDSATARIPVRSRRQAMDWSLVLASQEIGVAIDYSSEDGGWALLVAQADVERSLRCLRQYHLENPRPPWRQEVLHSGLLFDWVSLCWVLLVVVFFQLDLQTPLREAGLMDSALVAKGQWWRLFTAMWLHADLGHLASNVAFGIVLLGLAMGRYGTGVGLLAAYLAGFGGNIIAGLFWGVLSGQPHQSLGASGMVMGCLGLLATQSFTLWKRTPQATKAMLTGISGGVMLFVLLGLAQESDIMAHLGGFLTGLGLGAVLTLARDRVTRATVRWPATLLFVLLVIIPWWLALRHPPM